MANTLTSLIPDAYAALDVVSREMVGFIPSVMRDPSADRVAINQTLRSPYTSANTAGGNITPAMAFPAAAYQTIGNKSLTITKQRFWPFSWTGEEQYSLDQGPGALTIEQDQIAQAMRAGVNEMEADIYAAAYAGGSRAYGTVGTIPFTTNLAESAQIRKILDDNGAPSSGRSAVITTTTGAQMRTLAQLTKANEAGTTMGLRDGEILNINGISFKESAGVTSVTAGAMTGALFNGAGAVGDTTITYDTGTVNTTGLVAGDVITVGSFKYVVATGTTATSGTFTIQAPGLRAVVADNTAITVVATGARNVAFSSNAIVLATRLPMTPKGGDLAIGREIITDPRSGISFELVAYPGIDMITYHVRACWGVTVFKPEHVAILLE